MRKKRCIFCGSFNTKSCSIRSKMIIFFVKALIVDSDVMQITPSELPSGIGTKSCEYHHDSGGIGKLVGVLQNGKRSIFIVTRARIHRGCRVLCMSDMRIIFKHMMPNSLAPIIIMASLEFPKAIIVESSLSFLGLGVQPPIPSWGSILSNGKAFIGEAPWIAMFPGLMIMIVVLGFNLFGDALRDVLDPRLKN